MYHRIPRPIRKYLIELPINSLPSSELKKTRIRDVQRFLISANEPVVERYFRWMSTFKPAVKPELYTAEFAASVANSRSIDVLGKWFAEAKGLGILDSTLLTDQMTYLPNDLLVKVDIASMACSLEARSPFLDHNVIEFAASLPENIKMSMMRPKFLLKKVAARLVPREVIYRRKMGFGVPVGRWLRGEMSGFLREVLLAERSLNRGIIRPDAMRRYVDEHIEGKFDHSFQVWTLLMMELWFQRFIDQK